MTKLRDELQAVLSTRGFERLELVLDEDEAAARDAAPGVTVHLPDALRLALEAFTSGFSPGRPPFGETPAAVVRSAPDAFGLGADPTDDQVAAVIRAWLTDDPGARVVLLTPATMAMEPYRFPPEQGENPADHWVFRIVTPQAYPGLWWAIIDEDGEPCGYAYGYA